MTAREVYSPTWIMKFAFHSVHVHAAHARIAAAAAGADRGIRLFGTGSAGSKGGEFLAQALLPAGRAFDAGGAAIAHELFKLGSAILALVFVDGHKL